jgi:hypothetical protein
VAQVRRSGSVREKSLSPGRLAQAGRSGLVRERWLSQGEVAQSGRSGSGREKWLSPVIQATAGGKNSGMAWCEKTSQHQPMVFWTVLWPPTQQSDLQCQSQLTKQAWRYCFPQKGEFHKKCNEESGETLVTSTLCVRPHIDKSFFWTMELEQQILSDFEKIKKIFFINKYNNNKVK